MKNTRHLVALPDVQKDPSSKAARASGLRSHFGGVGLARGAYRGYVGMTKARPAFAKATAGRERHWLVCRSLGEGWRPFPTSGKRVMSICPILHG